MRHFLSLPFLIVAATLVAACPASGIAEGEVAEWGQCGGENWTGGTTCANGLACVVQNPYYFQCLYLPSSSGVSSIAMSTAASSASALQPSSSVVRSQTSPSSTNTPVQATTSATSPTVSSSTPSSDTNAASGTTYKASFTFYGSNDANGSGNCNVNTAACGFFTSPGFSVAASQALFGVGPGAGAGPACGTCWKIVGETDSSGNALSNAGTSIVVMVNNLCPADGNPLCAQSTLEDTNQFGANINFDLCSDSGAQRAFFGGDGVGLAIGTATQVDCSEWSGTVVH